MEVVLLAVLVAVGAIELIVLTVLLSRMSVAVKALIRLVGVVEEAQECERPPPYRAGAN